MVDEELLAGLKNETMGKTVTMTYLSQHPTRMNMKIKRP